MHNADQAWEDFQWEQCHEQHDQCSLDNAELADLGCGASVRSLVVASEAQFLASKIRERFEHIGQYEQQPWEQKRAAPEDQEQSFVSKRIPNEASFLSLSPLIMLWIFGMILKHTLGIRSINHTPLLTVLSRIGRRG